MQEHKASQVYRNAPGEKIIALSQYLELSKSLPPTP